MKGKETRNKIIQAAQKLFESQHYDSVSMDMIAKRAGVSKGCLYLYFESKKDLFTSIFEENIRLFEEFIASVVELPVAVEKKIEMILDKVDMAMRAGKILPFFPASREFSPEVHKAIGKKILPRIKNIRAKVGEIFRRAEDKGEIVSFPSDELALIFLAMVFAMFQEKRLISSMKKHIMDILFYGIKKRAKVDYVE